MQILNYKISNNLFILLIILFILLSINLNRVISFAVFPNKNRDSTESILKYVYYEIILQYLSWFSYLVFFLILIYINLKQTKNIYLKIFITFLFLFLIYIPIFPVLNIINIILIANLKNKPFIKNIESEFPLNLTFENNYNQIKNEYIAYAKNNNIDCFRNSNPLLSNIDSIDNQNNSCWRTLYLKTTGKLINDKKKFFPKTMELINNDQIHNAFFSTLDPHVEIKPHTGYFKGYLRYHLGIVIPEENGLKPYIICKGKKYEWTEGKGVLFDDMFLHYVKNTTNKQRVVLYLDIKRNIDNIFLKWLIGVGNYMSENSTLLKLFVKEQHVQDEI